MNFLRKTLLAAAVSTGLLIPVIGAAPAKTSKHAKDYQVTGPVLAIEDNLVTVQKDDEKWQIETSADTKMDGKLAVGQKVTIYYRMVATKFEKKADAKK
jgi:hypothetical protein